MADIRIKDLATTASSTASDDFLAVDGSANGTRKLNAYSPTFGGNLTVSGTGTFGGAATSQGAAGGFQVTRRDTNANAYILYSAAGNISIFNNSVGADFLTGDKTTNAASFAGSLSTAGNLTVSGGTVTSGSGTLTLNSSANTVVLQSAGTTALTLDSSQNAAFAGTGNFKGGTLTVTNTANTANIIRSSDSSGNAVDAAYKATGTTYAVQTTDTGGNLNTALTISAAQALRLNAYGAGTLTTDSSGNVTATSDERAKNITGTFTKGLAEVVKLTPKRYTWKPETGLNTTDEVVSLTAQDLIAAGLPEAVNTYRTVPDLDEDGKQKLDADGKPVTKRVDATYTVSDRAVIAALVNAVKELNAKLA